MCIRTLTVYKNGGGPCGGTACRPQRLGTTMIEKLDEAMSARHVEAYIRLEAATCEKKLRRGLGTVVWYDQLDQYCGTVWIRNV